MSRDSKLYLNDIINSCEKVLTYVDDMGFKEFCQDHRTYDAVVRNLEIIGEASKNIPPDVRTRFPNIEWKKIAKLSPPVIL